jgi:hypothetical protein
MVDPQIPATITYPMLSIQYLDRKDSKACTRELHPTYGDQEVHGDSTFYCKYLRI